MVDLLINKIARFNAFGVGALSIFLNLLLLYCINAKSTKHMAQYRVIMMIMCGFNIKFSIVHMLSVPTVHIHELDLLILNTGYIKDVMLGRILLVFFVFSFAQTIVLIASHFANRYLIICKSHFILHYSTCIYAIGFIISYFAIISWTAIFCVAVWPKRPEMESSVVAEHQLQGEPYLESPYMGNPAFVVSFAYLCLILITCMVISACANRGDRLQSQLFRCLVFQTLVPIICAHLPIYLAFVLPMFGTRDSILDLLPLPIAWYPAIDPIVVIFNVRSYKHQIFQLLRIPENTNSNSATMPVYGRGVSSQERTVRNA
ncbi:unnamed protein product, partial [Mesorhabditis spiculigera]